ncbi:MAG: SDR family oxidoreductase [Flavobacteriaceae bacterium]
MKNVIVTGTSKGIGYELALKFSENDYNVISLSRNNAEKLNKKNVIFFHLDISSKESIIDTVSKISKEFQQIDIIINNAGNLINKPFLKTSFEDFEDTYKVNVFGVAELFRNLFPFLSKKCHVVNISSIGGVPGTSKFPGLSAYSSSKAALNILTEMLAEEFKDTEMRFNTLALGSVQTEMLGRAFPGYKANTSPKDMADYIYKFSTDNGKFFNGKTLSVSSSNV